LDKSVIRALAQKSAWAAQHENVFVLGPTGGALPLEPVVPEAGYFRRSDICQYR